MGKARKSAVRRYHDRVAPHYDHSYDDAFWQWHDGLTWDYLKPHLPTDHRARVADLGCGTGKWAARLARSGFRLTGVDISPRMLEQARRKLDPISSTADFVQADLIDLSALDAGSYALAVALGDPIGCTSSPPRAMKQIRRILSDDGVLVATFDNRLSAIDFFLQKGDPGETARFLRNGRTHWLTAEPSEQFEIHTYSPSQVVKLCESCGFDVLEIVGKTVLPMRRYRHLLESPEERRRWARIEKSLARDRDAIPLASHLQVACRVRK